ncbi:RNA polymerase sigma factor for late transcription [Synechococcus phage BUCT-ZZ01]|nr:RNA polymerase sigma factor for late transcription [Synechococcus phage BUCT-ZZ01]
MATDNIQKRDEKAYYVSNKKLYAEIIPYINECRKAKEAGTPLPPIPRFVAESIMKIANKYANRPNFIGYSYRDEMICDAIYICCKGIHNFNPDKSENPFAYITTACHNAFLRRIELEHNQTSIKAKYINENVDTEFFESQEFDDSGEFRNNFVEFMKENSVYTDTIREKSEARKLKRKQEEENSLEKFFDDSDEANIIDDDMIDLLDEQEDTDEDSDNR